MTLSITLCVAGLMMVVAATRGAQTPAAPPSPCWAELFDEHGPQWASPTQPDKLDLSQLLSGVGCVLIARPADLWTHPEGTKLRSAEPTASYLRWMDAQMRAVAGVALADVEQVIIGLPNDPQQGYALSLVVRLKTPVQPTSLRKLWGLPVEWEHEGYTFFANGNSLFFIPPRQNGKQFGIALGVTDRKAIFRQLAGAQQGLWRRELEALLQAADASRHLTVVFAPNYLLGQGKTLLAGVSPVVDELKHLAVVDDRSRELAKGVLLSLHAGDEYLHLECRVEAGHALPPSLAAHLFHERLTGIPPRVRAQFAGHAPALGATAGRELLARYPLMLNALAGYLRSGVQGRQAVLTAALPSEAAHNLALGSAWALSVDLSAHPSQVRPLTFAERLAKRGDFKSPSDSLDRLVDQLRGHLGLEIDLIGQDLEVLGITKSKRFAIDLKNATAAEILTEFARLGNPAQTKHLGVSDQHLVWVIDDSRGPGKERIVFTSREAADRRGKLPPEFSLMSGGR